MLEFVFVSVNSFFFKVVFHYNFCFLLWLHVARLAVNMHSMCHECLDHRFELMLCWSVLLLFFAQVGR